LGKAWNVATDAMDRYRRHFGERNPLTLAAGTNQAIILRAMGERRRARQVGESSFYTLRHVLGRDHPYAIAAAAGLSNDLVRAHEKEGARRLLTRTIEVAQRVRGARHPDTLVCVANLALLDDPSPGPLGPSLGECEIEPPPV
jgi:hypothetical protein